MSSTFTAAPPPDYESCMGRWSQVLAPHFLRFAGIPSGGRVLDAGCGTGSLTMALVANAEVQAIEALDYEESFVQALCWRTSDPRISARQGDVTALRFGDAGFDAAYLLLVLHFVKEPDLAVREMRRVLRPGAVAAATVWAAGGLKAWPVFWDPVLELEPEADGGRRNRRRRMMEEGELRAAFAQAGFVEVVDEQLTIRMQFAGFDDFWGPMLRGQVDFLEFFEALKQERQDRLRDAVRAEYLAGGSDRPRAFDAVAWAVRGVA